MSDQSMLIFCFRGHTFVVIRSSTTIVFSRNSLCSFYSRNPTCEIPPCLRIFNRKYPPPSPIPSEFQFKELPLPFGNPKRHPWYRYGYFLESPIFNSLHGGGMDIFWNHMHVIKSDILHPICQSEQILPQ